MVSLAFCAVVDVGLVVFDDIYNLVSNATFVEFRREFNEILFALDVWSCVLCCGEFAFAVSLRIFALDDDDADFVHPIFETPMIL